MTVTVFPKMEKPPKDPKACCASRLMVLKQNRELRERVSWLEKKAAAWDYIEKKLWVTDKGVLEGHAFLNMDKTYVSFNTNWSLLESVLASARTDAELLTTLNQEGDSKNENDV